MSSVPYVEHVPFVDTTELEKPASAPPKKTSYALEYYFVGVAVVVLLGMYAWYWFANKSERESKERQKAYDTKMDAERAAARAQR